MNAPVTFDTLAFVKRMQAAGMAVPQAEALAQALNEVVFETVATKVDLRELELRLRHDLTVRMGAIVAAGVTLLGALISLH